MEADATAASKLFARIEAYRPGDLVFFPSGKVQFEVDRKSNKIFPSHVGIVLDHSQWIGSQSSTGVDKVAFNNVWWGSRPKVFLQFLKLR
jgi:cell wall-associated NlpC family hydrolase